MVVIVMHARQKMAAFTTFYAIAFLVLLYVHPAVMRAIVLQRARLLYLETGRVVLSVLAGSAGATCPTPSAIL